MPLAVNQRILMLICLYASSFMNCKNNMNQNKLLEDLCLIKPEEKFLSIDELLEASDNFNRKISKAPTSANWINKSMDKNELTSFLDFANSAYPILHEDILNLCEDFLKIKKDHGSHKEKLLYKSLTVIDLIDRIIKKRPLVFLGGSDNYLLRNGESGTGSWTLIGQDHHSQNNVPSIEDYMTYDEIKLAALLQVSSFVKPINSGYRKNCGKPTNINEGYDVDAVYVGAVGPRFEQPNLMEWQEIIKDESSQSESKDSKVANLFLKFYSERLGFKAHDFHGKFNVPIYRERISICAETYLLEANQRGKSMGLNVHVVVVGLGLGVWAFPEIHNQAEHFLNAFEKSIQKLWQQKSISYLKEVEFIWIPEASKTLIHDELLPGTDVKITFSKEDPFSRRMGDNNLKVAMFAWDGNSFPGNEYWYGLLEASGDPAAASCTQIPQLHNAYINIPNICASNIHIASPEFGVLHISEYAKKKIKSHAQKVTEQSKIEL